VSGNGTDDIAEVFRKAGTGDGAGVAEILRFRPELARCRDAAGLSMLRFARYMRHDAVLRLLVDSGPPLDIFDAAAIDDGARIEALLRDDKSLAQASGDDGLAPLHVAAACGSEGVIALLLRARAGIESRTADGRDQTALHAAVGPRQAGAVRALLRLGADPNAARRGGETPLMMAAAANDREILEMLVAHNANVELRDAQGRTAADVAVAHGHRELAARLRLGERVVDRRSAYFRGSD
jgi:ankyrin repeat protein